MNIQFKIICFLLIFLTTKSAIIFAGYLLGLLLVTIGILIIRSDLDINKSSYRNLFVNTLAERP